MTIHRRAARRDQGEAAIVNALRKVGAVVRHVSAEGLPDLLVGHGGRWLWLEVKQPLGSRGGKSKDGQRLQPAQALFFAEALLNGLPAHVVRSPEQALAVIGVEVVR